jgi:hypothetical protein
MTINGNDVGMANWKLRCEDRREQERKIMRDGTHRVRQTGPHLRLYTFTWPRLNATQLAMLRTMITDSSGGEFGENDLTLVDDFGTTFTPCRSWGNQFKYERRHGNWWSAEATFAVPVS